ncbi:MAG: IS1380 family transposase [Planctomycetota bacterium]|nr:IS1380 family transposase [Planctomycetota bacterium]
MGENKNHYFRLSFTDKLKAYFKGSEITSNGGLIAVRELDEQLGLTSLAEEYLADTRTGRNIQHELTELLRQSVYSRLAGYEDVIDADQLRTDPALRAILSERALEKNGSAEGTVGRFETEILTEKNNLERMDEMLFRWITKVDSIRSIRVIILDLDSSESPVYGEQEGGAYNGYFRLTCYHPLFCFNQYGDCLKVKLRPGNVHSAEGALEFIEPILRYYMAKGVKVILRGDAAFAEPEVFQLCEGLKAVKYAIRIKSNSRLEELVSDVVKTMKKDRQKIVTVYKDFFYQAVSWDKPRRIIAKIEWYPDELFPRAGFIVTSLGWQDKKVVKFYNKRGTCEQWIKEGKYALNWTKLSCQRFVENEARLKLFIMAYNLGNFLRTLALPERIKHWSLRSIQLKLIKIGGRLIKHARYYCLLLAESVLNQKIFASLIANIRRLCPDTG